MSFLNSLPTSVTIHRPEQTSDNMGGYTYNWVLVATTKCRLYNRSKSMKINDRGIDTDIGTKAIFNISDKNNLVNGYKVTADKVEYQIKRADIVYDSKSPHHMEAEMEFFK